MTHTIDGRAVADHELLEALGPQVRWLAKLVWGLGNGKGHGVYPAGDGAEQAQDLTEEPVD